MCPWKTGPSCLPPSFLAQGADHRADGPPGTRREAGTGDPDGQWQPGAQLDQGAGVVGLLAHPLVRQGVREQVDGRFGGQRLQMDGTTAVDGQPRKPPAAGHRGHAAARRQQRTHLGRGHRVVEQNHQPPVRGQRPVQRRPFGRPCGELLGGDAQGAQEAGEHLRRTGRPVGRLRPEVRVELAVREAGTQGVQPAQREGGLADTAEPAQRGQDRPVVPCGARPVPFQRRQSTRAVDHPQERGSCQGVRSGLSGRGPE